MNWKKIIQDLIETGHTFNGLGRKVGITGAGVRALTINAGQSPRWETGDALIALHKKAMRKKGARG